MLKARTCSTLLAFGLVGSIVSADVILSNYPVANDGTQSATLSSSRRKAMEFSMPPGGDYSVSALTLRLGNYDANDTLFVEIRDHNGTSTAPGSTVVGTFQPPTPGGAATSDYNFTPVGTIVLQGGTSYWLYVYGGESPTSFDWKASSPGITPTGIATFGPGNRFTTNSGSTWTASTILNSFNLEGSAGGGPTPCYANCDQSTTPPILNVADFTCFLQKFAAGDPYANCDGSTIPPVLNVADFTCFLQKFAAGCP